METDDDPDVREVVRYERRLHRPDVRGDAAVVEALLHPRFREFGASGQEWDAPTMVAALAEAPGEGTVETLDMAAQRVGPDAVLVTYRARTLARQSLRSSLWIREAGVWRLLFHQGTPLA